jgi:hypothetical protein
MMFSEDNISLTVEVNKRDKSKMKLPWVLESTYLS